MDPYSRRDANENAAPGATVTVRVIRSFEFRNWKPLVIRNVDLENTTTEGLQELVEIAIKNSTLTLPFKNYNFDTFKVSCVFYPKSICFRSLGLSTAPHYSS